MVFQSLCSRTNGCYSNFQRGEISGVERVIKESFVASTVISRRFKIIGIVLLLHNEESLSRNLTYTIVTITANICNEYYVTITNMLLVLTHSIFTITWKGGNILNPILPVKELKQKTWDFPRIMEVAHCRVSTLNPARLAAGSMP